MIGAGSQHSIKMMVPCAPRGDHMHATYDVKDILIDDGSFRMEELEKVGISPENAVEEVDYGVEHHLLHQNEDKFYPTILGLWYHAVTSAARLN